jgi:hypothetical protein
MSNELTNDKPFICGQSHNTDDIGMPDYVIVCRAPGADVAMVYKRIDSNKASEYPLKEEK